MSVEIVSRYPPFINNFICSTEYSGIEIENWIG